MSSTAATRPPSAVARAVKKYGWPHSKKAIEDIPFKDIFVMPGLMTNKKPAFEQVNGFD